MINKIDYWLGQDEDNEVVSTAIDCISELLELIGPLLLENYLPDLTNHLVDLLDGHGACNVNQDDDEDTDIDVKVFEAITNLLCILPKYIRKDYQ